MEYEKFDRTIHNVTKTQNSYFVCYEKRFSIQNKNIRRNLFFLIILRQKQPLISKIYRRYFLLSLLISFFIYKI